MKTSTLAVLGTSGRTGLRFVTSALSQGWVVRALVRTPASFSLTHPNLTVVEGDATDEAALSRLVTGASAVVSALGTPAIGDGNLQVRVMPPLVKAMQSAGVRRYVALTSSAAVLPSDETTRLGRVMALPFATLFPRYLADRMAEVEAVRDADLEWTLLRAGALNDSDATAYHVSLDKSFGLTAKTSRGAVAAAMLDALTQDLWVRRAPYLASA